MVVVIVIINNYLKKKNKCNKKSMMNVSPFPRQIGIKLHTLRLQVVYSFCPKAGIWVEGDRTVGDFGRAVSDGVFLLILATRYVIGNKTYYY